MPRSSLAEMRFKPIVAIDVDGVLRVGFPSEEEHEANTAAVFGVEITMHRGSFPKHLHGQPPWDEGGVWTDVHWFSRTGAGWVRDLVARGVDVRWATTWQDWANIYFAPVLGIPPLPVAVQAGVRRSEESPEWKARILAQAFPSRPVLWVDDILPWPRFDARRRPMDRAITRLQRINGCSGIFPADVTEMDQWLELASSPAGHEELRRQRRRERDREGAQRRRAGWGSEAAYRAWIPVRRRLRTELDLGRV